MTREELIDAGKVWIVYDDNDPDTILHEGKSKSACQKWIKKFKHGSFSIGKLIWEKPKSSYNESTN